MKNLLSVDEQIEHAQAEGAARHLSPTIFMIP